MALLELDTGHPAGWTHQLHEEKGNVLLSDGSVQQVTYVMATSLDQHLRNRHQSAVNAAT